MNWYTPDYPEEMPRQVWVQAPRWGRMHILRIGIPPLNFPRPSTLCGRQLARKYTILPYDRRYACISCQVALDDWLKTKSVEEAQVIDKPRITDPALAQLLVQQERLRQAQLAFTRDRYRLACEELLSQATTLEMKGTSWGP